MECPDLGHAGIATHRGSCGHTRVGFTPWNAATTTVPPASPSMGMPAFIYCAKENALFALQGA